MEAQAHDPTTRPQPKLGVPINAALLAPCDAAPRVLATDAGATAGLECRTWQSALRQLPAGGSCQRPGECNSPDRRGPADPSGLQSYLAADDYSGTVS